MNDDRYVVVASIIIHAFSEEEFQEAFNNRDWDDIEIISITEPEVRDEPAV